MKKSPKPAAPVAPVKKVKKTVMFTISLPEALDRAVRKKALEERRSISQMISVILEDSLAPRV